MTTSEDWMLKATNEEIEWVDALESGDYPKGCGYLNEDGKFCCLGVRCELDANSYQGLVTKVYGAGMIGYKLSSDVGSIDSVGMPTEDIRMLWGMSDRVADMLANINDRSVSFEPVIEAIKEWIASR